MVLNGIKLKIIMMIHTIEDIVKELQGSLSSASLKLLKAALTVSRPDNLTAELIKVSKSFKDIYIWQHLNKKATSIW